jgi:hypothetical protein
LEVKKQIPLNNIVSELQKDILNEVALTYKLIHNNRLLVAKIEKETDENLDKAEKLIKHVLSTEENEKLKKNNNSKIFFGHADLF